MNEREFELRSRVDGFRLVGTRWEPDGPARATVVIAHGAAEHLGRYRRFATALTSAGYAVMGIDHRGHGRSAGPGGLGDFGLDGAAAFAAMAADVGQVVEAAKAAHPGRPAVLFGHSMGAGIAQRWAPEGSREIAALVLSGSSATEPPQPGEAPPVFNPNAAFEPARTPYDWLSRDPAEVDRYIADPWCGFEKQTARRERVNVFELPPAEVLAQIRPDLPVLLVAGDADPINRGLEGLRLLEARWREAGVQRIDRLFYPGGRHEMLNEINREQVTADIIGWLDRVLGAA
jgi:alpha-beta hydrolase superfamily lysophospholipase